MLGIFSSHLAFSVARGNEIVAACFCKRIIAARFILRDSGDFGLRGREMLSELPVLIICSDSAQGAKADDIVRGMGLQSVICSSLTDARSLIARQPFQLILCDDSLPDCNLRTSLKVLSSATGGVPVVVLSHLAEWDSYMKALSAGAFDYIALPPERVETERILRLALNQNPRARSASHSAA
jgi:DNA-binding NtrC family response regulator